jgi:predicted enzyme related to lactoylglutathione lyase
MPTSLRKKRGGIMDHLSNWIEIPVVDMKRARKFYAELLGVVLDEMPIGSNEYALFELKDRFNTGCLVKGDGYVPSMQGVVVYLNGGDDLSPVLIRVEKAGGKVLLKKTFLSKEAGHIAYFVDTEGNKVGLHSMN